ncbi:hypothetical protein EX30DRAFT_388966 [Ascodesmis nigricans]|uniref:Uncharacterized protein n=1 Tax=Ascodesmis nigricans TaxID=341454 RepID=A0A4S2MQZ5_9PEZI|nr:hypothetical protein EX30DRAFT_388966 [Ascodesmis nigricans]
MPRKRCPEKSADFYRQRQDIVNTAVVVSTKRAPSTQNYYKQVKATWPQTIKGYLDWWVNKSYIKELSSVSTKGKYHRLVYKDFKRKLALDTHVYPHERYRIQFHLAIMLMAYTSSRPGTIVESSCYTGCNKGLTYRDFNLTLFPNPWPGEGDLITLEVTLHHLKEKRSIGEKLALPCHAA